MEGIDGYNHSWQIVQRSVDVLMTESLIPVPKATIKNREPRHLPKRRIGVNLRRDVLLNNLIVRTQKFQLEYEKENEGKFLRQVIIDYPTENQKPRKERHYDFWPFFEQLPNVVEKKVVAPIKSKIVEEEPIATLEFASNNDIDMGEECKENMIFLPAPLSDDITKEIAALFPAEKPVSPSLHKNFYNRYMRKGPFSKMF
ncbi:hypothetical protein L5515_016368 [Caenorhabditis briggsae]|nr:hypothetical protein L5515_016368 [Caenorhabditis briggsae]